MEGTGKVTGCIVIVNYRRPDDVTDLARRLSWHPAGGDRERWLVYVVDNSGDVDDTGLDPGGVRVDRPHRNLGYAGACNAAVSSLQTAAGPVTLDELDWIAFASHDVGLDRERLADLAAAWRANPERVVGPCLTTSDGKVFSSGIGGHPLFPRHWSSSCEPPDGWRWALDGALWLVAPALLRRVGPLDERYFLYWEDVDWFWRLRQLGMGTVVRPHIEVSSSPAEGSLTLAYYTARNRYVFARAHGFSVARSRSAFWLAMTILRFSVAALRGHRLEREKSKARWWGLVDGVRGAAGQSPRRLD